MHKIPFTWSSHGSSIGEPPCNTTITFFCTLQTASIKAFWFSGRFKCSRSNPSDSKASGSPANITAASEASAVLTASSINFWSGLTVSASNPFAKRKQVSFSFNVSIAQIVFEAFMWLLPLPWYRGYFAKSPITAILVSFFNGRMSSFFKRTAHCAANSPLNSEHFSLSISAFGSLFLYASKINCKISATAVFSCSSVSSWFFNDSFSICSWVP